MKNRIKSLIILVICAFPLLSVAEGAISQFGGNNSELPLWYDKNGYTDEGKMALKVLESAAEHGIEPQRYIAILPKKDDEAKSDKVVEANEQITQSLTQYLMDLRFGVTKSDSAISKLSDEEKASYQNYFLNALNLIADSDDSEEIIENFASKDPQYKKLKSVLSVFKQAKDNNLIEQISVSKSIKEGETNAEVTKIRSNLAIITSLKKGEYPESIDLSGSNIFDAELVEAVKNFQSDIGIAADGSVGRQTAAKINSYASDAVDQIALTMEKMRSSDTNQIGKYIVVNIPEYTLYAYDNGELKMTMPVIVGAQGNPTPEFKNHINNIVINPDWTPTPRITRNELLPKIRKNPDFLAKSGYEVKWLETNEVISKENYNSIDWNSVDVSQIKIRQPSGGSNALGNIKFLMPESDSIYLHDTNNRSLFKNTFRALSHGCIRLGEPMKLAEFVLGEEQYKKLNIDKIAGRTSTKSIKVEDFPVYLTYKTAAVNEDGIRLLNDVYNKSSNYKKLMASKVQRKLVASISPTYPSSYWANVNMDEVALAVKPNTP